MNDSTPRIRRFIFQVAALGVLALPFSISDLAAQDIGPAPADAAPADFSPPPASVAPDGVEVLTRGVVHEAFAEVVTDPKPGLIVTRRPPEAIDEVPPEFKPEEEGAIWITGYWAWDDERADFFWQSGAWRVPPPGQRWVAGYWHEVPSGWQWVSGFWVPTETEEVLYYPAPPASLEAGPTSPSPGDDYFWATGSWTNNDIGYRWQPGHWAPFQESWVWISPRYAWTPAGCVYLPGHWDYRLTRRGCLFAPVYFTRPIYTRPNYVYRPWCALNTQNMFVHLWVRPNYNHFYFGNYYGSNWGSWGVTPWCQYRPYRNCYDPMLTQLQCHYRQTGVNYISRLEDWHNHYANNATSRPPRTWNEQVQFVSTSNISNTNVANITSSKSNVLAVNLNDASKHRDLNMKFARLDGTTQNQAMSLARETRDVRFHRSSIERTDTKFPVRLTLPTVQVAAVKRSEMLVPPKLTQLAVSQSRVELNGDQNRNRNDGRGPFGSLGPDRKVKVIDLSPVPAVAPSIAPDPKTTAKPPAKVEAPRPRDEKPARQLRTETPHPQPRLELPQPKVELLKSQPSKPQVELPRARMETVHEQPQIRLDIPTSAAKIDAAPRVQIAPHIAPHIETPKPEAPKHEPHHGGENHPHGGHDKK